MKADSNAMVTDTSIFQAASLSKVVLAYITLIQVDKGTLDLDKPLYSYYAYPKIAHDTAAQRITARMVLHHLSGLPNWGSNPTLPSWDTAKLSLKNKPATLWGYSGEGFMYLQKILVGLTHASLEELAMKEVFLPFGMHHSSFVWQPSFETNGVYGHDEKSQPTRRVRMARPSGAYSLLTTAHDYTLFLQALMQGKGLSNTSYQMLFNDLVPVRKNSEQSEATDHVFWGLGIGIQQSDRGKALWHWGDNGDQKCFFMALPATSTSLVLLTNSANGPKIMSDVLSRYFGPQRWWAVEWLNHDF
jgi:CubicO group peptidase (beta-lactamase class C family)